MLHRDPGCFAVGTDQGFRIYNCEPFKETFRRDFTSGGIGMVEMLFRCNILALVGGGKNPRYPPHKVMIWDDHQNRCIGELSFRTEVKAVRLRRDRVVVALSNKVYVYNFADLSLLDHIETVDNPRGLLVVCPNPSNNVIACPGMQKGHVRVEVSARVNLRSPCPRIQPVLTRVHRGAVRKQLRTSRSLLSLLSAPCVSARFCVRADASMDHRAVI